ncbi:MAG TPA: hypothetical protein VFA03_13375 [Acetobacteraceae bacterium]|nr:hypothetical protein [Acetobacteraceae bacterium]
MKRLISAFAAMLLAGPACAQDGGSVFTNNPNELPQFLLHPPRPAEWAGQFFHLQIPPRSALTALARPQADAPHAETPQAAS